MSLDLVVGKPTPAPDPPTVRPREEFGGDEPLDFELQQLTDAISQRAKKAKGLGPRPGKLITRSLLGG